MNSININAPKGDQGIQGIQGKQGVQGIQGKKGLVEFTGSLKTFLHFSDKIKEQIIFMMFFAMLFAGLGYYIPKTYFKYFDKTLYYEVKLPIKVVNKIYYPCDYVDVLVTRRALISVKSEAMVELRLYREDNSGVKDLITKEFRNLAIIKSATPDFNTVMSHWSLPCTIQPGRYLFEGGAPYVVNGEQKFTPLVTEDFIVHASPSATIK